MTYEQALQSINSLLLFGSRPGLSRIRKLMEKLGSPQDRLKYIHVAGTNGKGSTCMLLAETLKAAGYKTGLFVSPYVIEFRERMQINNQMIPKDELIKEVEEIFPIVESLRAEGVIITEFELITAISFHWFDKNNCDVVVLETGMGGRVDCTNIIGTPLASVITSISLDHTAVLGDTIEEIAKEKAGIIKANGNTVFYPQEDTVNRVIETAAKEHSNALVLADSIPLTIEKCEITHTLLRYKDKPLKLKLIGKHQICNAKLALAVIERLNETGALSIRDDHIAQAFAQATMPARLELLSTRPIILLDGAHNPAGMQALGQAIQDYLSHKKIVCIMGMLQDKDSNSSLEYLDGLVDEVITLEPNSPRRQTADELAEKAVKFFDRVYPMDNFGAAIDKAMDMAGENGVVLVCGSLYLASQLRPLIKRKLEKRR